MNRFITEKDVEEAKRKREEEWQKARQEGRELPKEDEVVDKRSLYERLKEQKDRKQEDFEEQLKFKNMIYKGLNDEDASFLSTVARKQAEIDAKRFDEESVELKEYRAALENTPALRTSTHEASEEKKKTKIASDFIKTGKSQTDMLSGFIRKRKSTDSQLSNDQKPKSTKQDDRLTSDSTANTKVNKGLTSLADYSSSSEEDNDNTT